MTKKHDIIWLESVDSTNEEARRRISDIDNLSVLSALEQTAGRGQRGNKWTSKAGDNLLFSIVLKLSPDDSGLGVLDARDQFALNEIAALSVVDFLRSHEIQAQIKWPNDIYVGSRKICGILIENSLRGKHVSSSIIGIGLNINQRNFDVNLPNPTSMVLSLPDFECHSVSPECKSVTSQCHSERIEDIDEAAVANAKESFDIRACLEEFMDIFTSYHDRYLAVESELSPLRQLYLSNLWRLDLPAEFIDYTSLPSGHLDAPMNICTDFDGTSAAEVRPRRFHGIIRGLSDIGNLMVEDISTGHIREFGFKEIGYILE